MKKITKTIIATIFLFFLPLPVLADVDEIPVDSLIFNNFVETNCQNFNTPPQWKIMELYEGYMNTDSPIAAKGCKGQVCWSWQTMKGGADFFNWQLYDSTLPLKITNVEKIAKTISQTIKQTDSLRKSSSSLTDAVQEFLKSSFSSGKERTFSKERSMTESKTQEQATEVNVTPAFHKYLGMALQGPFITQYPLCIASSVELFFKAYDSNKVNDLVEAFVIFKIIQPEDIEFSKSKTALNRAKFLYSVLAPEPVKAKHAWAQATLFAKLLDWQEFEKIRNIVDNYIDQVYGTYSKLSKNTTKALMQSDKLLAAIKYTIDKNFATQAQIENAKVEDEYTTAAIYYHLNEKNEQIITELEKRLEQAIQNNDPLLEKKFVKSELNKNIQKYAIFVVPVAVVAATTAIIIIKKKRKQS